jgi:hypothetical protein
MMASSRPDDDELRRRGLELQAALPEPSSRALEHERRQESRTEGEKTAEGVAWLGLEIGHVGIWGLVLVVPYLIIHLWRRLRRFADSDGGG